MTIPALAGEQEPRETVSLRLSHAERLGLDVVAWSERLPSRRPGPNRSGAAYLLLAYGFRHCPAGWRPANGLIVPGQGEPAPIVNRQNVFRYLAAIGTERGLLERIIHEFAGDTPDPTPDPTPGTTQGV